MRSSSKHGRLWIAIVAAAVLTSAGCRQYNVTGSKLRLPPDRSPEAASARARVKPGLRAGVSETSQDIERSLGY